MQIIKNIALILLIVLCINCTGNKSPNDIDSEKKLIFNATILTMNDNMEILEDAYLIIENNVILEIGVGEEPDIDGYKIDAKDQILMPGFVNTHTHIPDRKSVV